MIHCLIVEYDDSNIPSSEKFWKKFSPKLHALLCDTSVVDLPLYTENGFKVYVALSEKESIDKAEKISELLIEHGVSNGEVAVAPRKIFANISLSPLKVYCDQIYEIAKEIAKQKTGNCVLNYTGGWQRIFINIPVASGSPWEAEEIAGNIFESLKGHSSFWRHSPTFGHIKTFGETVWKRHLKEFIMHNAIGVSPPTTKKPKL